MSQNYGIPPECVLNNMLGQAVNGCAPLASGYYLASNQAVDAMNEAGTNTCPEGMRPGQMVIKGLPTGPISTCGGRLITETMPDMHIVNWRYRIYVNMVLVVLVVVLLGSIGYKLVR